MPTIHPTALVAPTAELADDVQIGPYAIIEDDVTIGARTVVDAHAVIKRYTRLGEENHIHSHAVVGGEPQDLKFSGEVTWLEIGKKNSIREFSTMHRGTQGGGGLTKIGNNNLFMAYSHVAHDCLIGDHVIMSNAATLGGHIHVENYVSIGGLSAVHQFCHLGEHAFIGGMTGVVQDVPPWMLVAGGRGHVYGPNVVGLRRINAPSQLHTALKSAFRLIWKSTLPREEALCQLLEEYGNLPDIQNFVDFIKKSTRGISSAEKSEKTLDKN